eukprot:TRINITY_DN17884_c0_g1_i1.p1 TRINITY_DN17884_c0_g1~~TRINITY_DN17884_c0_g1_i1.p1  ORF type:complete len:379 (+),score=126.09 TRINITY_DN17884_c0_g1_i1:105-1241(+)
MTSLALAVARADITRTRAVAVPQARLPAGGVRLRVEKFAFTANNVSYAGAGESLAYFSFFPLADAAWGVVPVWGVAVVVDSADARVRVGQRVYGFFPAAQAAVLQVGRFVDGVTFVDATPHRRELPSAYNAYTLLDAPPPAAASQDGADAEDVLCLYRPLFLTSWILAVWLAEHDAFGADAVLISSASSKTSYGLAYALRQASGGRRVKTVGITSGRSRGFVVDLGVYDEVVTYDAVRSVPPGTRVAYIDMSGSAAVLKDLHTHFGENVAASCMVGQSHWDAGGRPKGLPGAKPKFFFAPTHINALRRRLGNDAFTKRVAAAWGGYVAHVQRRGWVAVRRVRGGDALQALYREFLANAVPPEAGCIATLQGDGDRAKL